MPARYVFLDEVDAYEGDVDGEGDPVALAIADKFTQSAQV
jgi:phage terminase large subunit GpA-like protein